MGDGLDSLNAEIADLALKAENAADMGRQATNGNLWRAIAVLAIGRLIRNHGVVRNGAMSASIKWLSLRI